MPSILSRKKLQSLLENVEPFSNPKIELEQYCTSAQVAADILFNMQMVDESIEGMTVCDLGCGSGMLSIGACLLGASHVIAFDIDPDAVSDFRQNLEDGDLTDEGIEITLADVTKMWTNEPTRKVVDTTILNPPFGTNANNNGLDMEFLKVALSISQSHVYSLHKTTTRDHVLKTIKNSGAEAKVVGEIRFDLPRTYKRHRKESVDIAVDLVHSWFKD